MRTLCHLSHDWLVSAWKYLDIDSVMDIDMKSISLKEKCVFCFFLLSGHFLSLNRATTAPSEGIAPARSRT
jgi:hypothetical protein